METLDLIAIERRRVADMLDTLTPEQWETQSLCSAWTVREAAAHLTAGWNISYPTFAKLLVRHRGFDGANAAFAKMLAKRPTDEIVDDLRDNAAHPFKPPIVGHLGQLGDVISHSQDITRPLGIDHEVDPSHVRPALDLTLTRKARAFLPSGHQRGLRFVATDGDWATGEGPEVCGESRSILLVMLGRWCENHGLTGDGVEVLQARLA